MSNFWLGILYACMALLFMRRAIIELEDKKYIRYAIIYAVIAGIWFLNLMMLYIGQI